MTREEFLVRETALKHAIQTGVMYEQERGSQDGTPKHLRTGLNSALCDHASLVALLVRRGVLTYEEYYDAAIAGLEDEVRRYEQRLSTHYGVTVTLG